MTARTTTAIKALFETGDIPDGTDYGDLADSYLNVVDTTSQTVIGDVVLSGTVYLESSPTFAAVTASVSASASASKYAIIEVSGVSYGIKLFKI